MHSTMDHYLPHRHPLPIQDAVDAAERRASPLVRRGDMAFAPPRFCLREAGDVKPAPAFAPHSRFASRLDALLSDSDSDGDEAGIGGRRRLFGASIFRNAVKRPCDTPDPETSEQRDGADGEEWPTKRRRTAPPLRRATPVSDEEDAAELAQPRPDRSAATAMAAREPRRESRTTGCGAEGRERDAKIDR